METIVWLGLNLGAWIAIVAILCMFLTLVFTKSLGIFDELDYVICWDVNDTDIQELHTFGIECEKVEPSSLYPTNYPKSVTHRLSISNCNPVYVIDLKELVYNA